MYDLVFDIETGPDPTAKCPEFDSGQVKTGNIKDADKIREKVEAARAAFEADFLRNAALSPLTGRVLAIGLLRPGETPEKDVVSILGADDEKTLIESFWHLLGVGFNPAYGTTFSTRLVGWNSNQFDLPFLFKRAWKYGLPVPSGLRTGRYWNDGRTLDIRDIWGFGDRMAPGSLDVVGKHLGVGAKTGSGADFARLWVEDRAQACAYLENDVRLTAAVARRLGVDLRGEGVEVVNVDLRGGGMYTLDVAEGEGRR